MSLKDKPLVWLHGEVKTPPLSQAARLEAGYLLRRLQQGELLGMPQSRPMPSIGPQCHELRIPDEQGSFRIIYRLDDDAVVIAEVFAKKTRATPFTIIEVCRKRLREYDDACREEKAPGKKGMEGRHGGGAARANRRGVRLR